MYITGINFFHSNPCTKRQKHKGKTQQVCARTDIIFRRVCCVIQERNPIRCVTAQASFDPKGLRAACLIEFQCFFDINVYQNIFTFVFPTTNFAVRYFGLIIFLDLKVGIQTVERSLFPLLQNTLF
jgi:hypothetical protein